ncbi:MAG TPA: cytochrome c [Pyrinomonadaceae bacterium]|nr:cytochrome c [Pyrinomonadaceae bacterium]
MRGKRGIWVLRVTALLVAAICTHLVISSGVAPVAAQKRARRGGSPTASDAKSLFNQRCAKCHGADGRAHTVMGEIGIAPNFTERRWQEGVSDRRLTNSIMYGREGMPAFRSKLSQKQIKALVAYVRAFDKGGGGGAP